MQYPEIEAYLVIFSLTDRLSFRYACDVLRLLRHHSRTDASVIVVGNKSDLVRGRRVTDDGITFLLLITTLLHRVAGEYEPGNCVGGPQCIWTPTLVRS